MLKINDKVEIKSTGHIGYIEAIRPVDGQIVYIVSGTRFCDYKTEEELEKRD